jgi:undecaprenyl diphosphate synthase
MMSSPRTARDEDNAVSTPEARSTVDVPKAGTALSGGQAEIISQPALVPRHVAIIMDGNGRWAEARNLPRLEGHRAGMSNIHRIIPCAIDLGIAMLTLYAFSTENWGRPREEVSGLMRLFALASRRDTQRLHRNGVRVRHVGSFDGVNPSLERAILGAVELTKGNTRLTLNIAFNYGGRAEIVNAVRQLVREGAGPDQVTEEAIAGRLYTAGLPDPDLIIRTAGEMRLSNFLLWQAAYSEYYSSPKCWPDFGPDDLTHAVESFAGRKRKYGRL